MVSPSGGVSGTNLVTRYHQITKLIFVRLRRILSSLLTDKQGHQQLREDYKKKIRISKWEDAEISKGKKLSHLLDEIAEKEVKLWGDDKKLLEESHEATMGKRAKEHVDSLTRDLEEGIQERIQIEHGIEVHDRMDAERVVIEIRAIEQLLQHLKDKVKGVGRDTVLSLTVEDINQIAAFIQQIHTDMTAREQEERITTGYRERWELMEKRIEEIEQQLGNYLKELEKGIEAEEKIVANRNKGPPNRHDEV
jgi:hypothetical protein